MDDLKAKIAALQLDEGEHPAHHGGFNTCKDLVLEIIATHAAEPAPVAVEGAPERVWLDADAEAGEGKFPRCFENPKYCNEPPIEYIRADLAPTGNSNQNYGNAVSSLQKLHRTLAPTGNTALVEAARREGVLEGAAIARQMYQYEVARAIEAHADTHHAAPQPTPEVGALRRKAQAYDDLREMLGYVQNGSDTPVSISQDDATNSFIVKWGKEKAWDRNLPDALAALSNRKGDGE